MHLCKLDSEANEAKKVWACVSEFVRFGASVYAIFKRGEILNLKRSNLVFCVLIRSAFAYNSDFAVRIDWAFTPSSKGVGVGHVYFHEG